MTINIQNYTKKPVTNEAIKFGVTHSVEDIEAIAEWCGGTLDTSNTYSGDWSLSIPTLEGTSVAMFGEYWVVKDSKGFYPVRNDIFEETYELSESDPPSLGEGVDPNELDGFAEVIEFLGVGASEDGFRVVAKQYVSSSRWYENWLIVITDGEVHWLSTYEVPATEMQEGADPDQGRPTKWVRVTQGEPTLWSWDPVAA